jgi:hypothetical protein
LSESEVFPSPRIGLAGRGWARDKVQTSTECAWTARGDMANALGSCQRVVRATLVDDRKQVAVTIGVAVMPTEQEATAVSNAGNPSDRQNWFRGMRGRTAETIDEAAGIPAITTRGRYVIYAYVAHADGRNPAPGDPALTQIGQAAIDYAKRPIDKRAR